MRGVPVDLPRVEFVQSTDWESLLRRDEATLKSGGSNSAVFDEKQMDFTMINHYNAEPAVTVMPWEMANNDTSLTAYESNMWGINQPYQVERDNPRVQNTIHGHRWNDGGKPSVLWQSFAVPDIPPNPNSNSNKFTGLLQGNSVKGTGGKLSALLSLFPVMKQSSRSRNLQVKEHAIQNDPNQPRLQDSGVRMVLEKEYGSSYPYDTGVASYGLDEKAERRRKLDNLLIKPIVTMKGRAYDDIRGWWDFDTERDFHSSCTKFFQIVMLSDAQETAQKIKQFLTSDLLEPIYTPSEQAPPNIRLNHFTVFWNVMHQLPFYVKKYDQQTQEKLIWFYGVGVRDTLPCAYCRKHYMKWLRDRPIVESTGSLEEMNMWMFQLHDHVNWSSKKPHFQWAMYKRRWAPRGKGLRTSRAPESIRGNESDVKVNEDHKDVVRSPNRVENQESTALHPLVASYDNEVPVYPADIPVFPADDIEVPTAEYGPAMEQYHYRDIVHNMLK